MKKGASTIEYAILMLVIVLAVTAIFSYTKRAICGKMRESADVFGYGRQ
jgi:Flp pilus assembly pilin Flp